MEQRSEHERRDRRFVLWNDAERRTKHGLGIHGVFGADSRVKVLEVSNWRLESLTVWCLGRYAFHRLSLRFFGVFLFFFFFDLMSGFDSGRGKGEIIHHHVRLILL